jgi:hypothetical protein
MVRCAPSTALPRPVTWSLHGEPGAAGAARPYRPDTGVDRRRAAFRGAGARPVGWRARQLVVRPHRDSGCAHSPPTAPPRTDCRPPRRTPWSRSIVVRPSTAEGICGHARRRPSDSDAPGRRSRSGGPSTTTPCTARSIRGPKTARRVPASSCAARFCCSESVGGGEAGAYEGGESGPDRLPGAYGDDVRLQRTGLRRGPAQPPANRVSSPIRTPENQTTRTPPPRGSCSGCATSRWAGWSGTSASVNGG